MKRVVAFDFETQDLMSAHDFTHPVWGVSFAERGPDNQVCTWSLTDYDQIKYFFTETRKQYDHLVCHNATFDVAVLYTHYDIDLEDWDDTQLVAYSVDPSYGGIEKYSLDSLCERYLGIKKMAKPDFSLGWSEKMQKYCEHDAKLTLALFYKVYPLLKTDPYAFMYYEKLDKPYQKLVLTMESGTPVDVQHLEKLHALYDRYVGYIDRKITKFHWASPGKTWEGRYVHCETLLSGHQYVTTYSNVNKRTVWAHCELDVWNRQAPQQNAEVLVQYGGVKPDELSTTKSGKLSVNKEAYERLADQSYLALLLHKLNVAIDMRDRFVGKLLENTVYNETFGTGLLYANFNQTATATRRLSSSKPNLQNIPSERTLGGKRIRRAFVAPKGVKVVCGDLDRIELVVTAYLLEVGGYSTYMADAVRQGVDLHQLNADTWGLTEALGPKQGRWVAKKVIFTLIYGAGPSLIAKETKGVLNIKQAQQLKERIFKETGLDRLKNDAIRRCRMNGGVYYDFIGGKLVLPHIRGPKAFEAERQLGNYMVQCPAGGIFKELQLRAKSALKDYLVKQTIVVHDETYYLCLEPYAQEVCDILNSVYTANDILVTHRGYIPVKAEFHIADNWADAKQ